MSMRRCLSAALSVPCCASAAAPEIAMTVATTNWLKDGLLHTQMIRLMKARRRVSAGRRSETSFRDPDTLSR